MTLSKLAQLANVSVSVVSKAFSGRDDISEAMREHVFQVAREHGCFRQFYHVPYDKPVVAVIVPEVISQYYIHFIEVLQRCMEENGYTMLLSISNFDRQLVSELVRYYTVHNKVDGLLLLSPADDLPADVSTAIVTFGMGTDQSTGTYIYSDRRAGVAAALRALKENGHRRIGYVGEPFTHSQYDMLRDELTQADLEIRPEWLVTSHARFEDAGRDGLRRIWTATEKPSAIFGAYGYITRGILQEVTRMGLRIPHDVSVISMDSDPAPLDPLLDVTCIRSAIEERCAAAMRVLAQRIHSGEPNAFCQIVLPAVFYKGETVRRTGEQVE